MLEAFSAKIHLDTDKYLVKKVVIAKSHIYIRYEEGEGSGNVSLV